MAGISAVFSEENAPQKTYNSLFQIQHRAQEYSGMAFGGSVIRAYSETGNIERVLQDIMTPIPHPSDYASIGYVGKKRAGPGPPIEIESKDYKVAVVMDGFILNHSDLDNRFGFTTSSYEELFGKIFLNYLDGNILDSVGRTMKETEKGSYSLVMMVLNKKDKNTQLIALRDKRGMRPMSVGKNKDFIAASESVAVDVLERIGGKMEKRDVFPGEVWIANKNGFENFQVIPPEPAYCALEWTFRSRQDSSMNGKNVHKVRKLIGNKLGKLIEDDGNSVVVYVPDSGKSVALGIHEETRIPIDEGIIRNPHIGRIEIEDPKKRDYISSMRYNVNEEVVGGERVIVGEDSIVSGETVGDISNLLKVKGAKKVDFAVGFPPIIYPQFEDGKKKTLIAADFIGMSNNEIGKKVAEKIPNVDNIIYIDRESLVEAIGIDELCTYCFSGENPFE